MKIAISLVLLYITLTLTCGMWVCEKVSDLFQRQGFQLSMSGDETGAVECYDTAISINPRSSTAFLNRGQSKRAIGQCAAALDDLDQAIELGGSKEFLSVAYAIRGSIKEELSRPAEAIKDYSKAINLECPITLNVLHDRAMAKEAVGDIEGALNDIDECMNLSPSDSGLFLDRGRVRLKQGDRSGAIADLKKSLDLDPADKAGLERLLNDIEDPACSKSTETDTTQTSCPASSEGPIC
ncbi:MAG: tetratricopeptide repeat protein [Cyanobacteria bacterium]|nr:tetratricopeptide repeat protein [Cyanobacteriota bacterium]